MVILSDVLPALSLTTATGCAGLILGTTSTLITARRACLAVQAAGALLFAIHYGLLGASTGTLMCALGLVQMATAYPEERPAWTRALFLATLPAGLCVAAATWHGVMTAFSAIGFVLGTVGRWQTSMGAMRGCYATATLFGAGHNALAGSMFGLGSDALALSGHLWSLWRQKTKRPPAGTGGRVGAADRVSAWLPPRRPAPCVAGRSW
ncbi:YgjV family protein [Azospirillum sp.]|uniref:YgjV family protein n=1 Tax=Azospirillum sp. TaxID=34012 RepID=UPI003D756E6F